MLKTATTPRRAVRYVFYAMAALLLLVIFILAVGFALPSTHTAIVRADYKAPPESIYAAVTAVKDGPSWRSGLDSVKILPAANGRTKWTEYAEWGNLTMVMEEAKPVSRVVTRIADTSQGFGGSWTFLIQPNGSGSTLTLTENGEIYPPVFRFMSKFVFGQYTSLETYAANLARKFGETPRMRRGG